MAWAQSTRPSDNAMVAVAAGPVKGDQEDRAVAHWATISTA